MQKIGRYQIVSELGKGAMGVVYKAQDPTVGRCVAIKTLRLDLHGTEAEEMLGRFKNEARTAGVMNHPNIITIYDAGEQDGMFYIAMEYMEGQTLQQLLKGGKRLPVEHAVDIVRQVCAGLDYAHSRGIIHRDIKPANIMITADGTVKIMDFGIAKGGGTDMTTAGHVVGTPNYMAPEQVKGKPLDGRSDLFSVGVVLYEMLTGERPFAGENITTIIYKIVNDVPVDPRERDHTMHPGISAVVMKALSKDPDGRFAAGADFARAVLGYLWFKPEVQLAPVPVERFASSSSVETTPLPSGPMAAAVAAAATQAKTPPPVDKLETAPPAGVQAAVTTAAPSTTLPAAVVVPVAKAAPAPPIAKPAPIKLAVKPAALNTTVALPPRPAKPQPQKPVPVMAIGAVLTAALALGAYWHFHQGAAPVPAPVAEATAPAPAEPKPRNSAKAAKAAAAKRAAAAADSAKSSTPASAAGLKGSLDLDSEPNGAHIYLDGRDSGEITPAHMAVNPGQHRIALRKEGYRPEIKYADVQAGGSFEFAPTLTPAAERTVALAANAPAQPVGSGPFRRLRRIFGRAAADDGVLEVRTRPRGAEIWLGEAQAPLRTPAKLGVVPGNYTMTLRLPGYKPITRPVQIEQGKMLGVEEIFEPQ
ncbi:MAG: serine/threonine-protein kinase [Terriglobales bacterium]